MKVKLFTPLVVAAATGIYFIPVQAKQVKKLWHMNDNIDSPQNSSVFTIKLDPQGAVSGVGIGLGNGIMGGNNARMTSIRDALPDNPSSSQWSWWKNTDTGIFSALSFKRAVDSEQNQKTTMMPKKVVIDKVVSAAAVKGHDALINRASMVGKNAEETALKVHDNVINAALPARRMSRHEKRPIEISRQASESDLKDGKFVVRVVENSENPQSLPERVRRGSNVAKKDLHHGLENLDKRASMIYKGVEHVEHDLNKRIEKSLQEEADYWHQQSLMEESRSRGGERAM
ncbi:hypothetical protein BGZ76_003851 [Entomortierella beljakovae]|nr:hypothetical protein BGZ76_003851 [Entomortierella beljakovae]